MIAPRYLFYHAGVRFLNLQESYPLTFLMNMSESVLRHDMTLPGGQGKFFPLVSNNKWQWMLSNTEQTAVGHVRYLGEDKIQW